MSIRHTDQSIKNHVQQSLGTKEGCGARRAKEGREGRGEGCRGGWGGGKECEINQWSTFDQGVIPNTCCVLRNQNGPRLAQSKVLKSNVQRLLKTTEGRVVNVQRLLKSREGRTISGQRLLKVSLAPSLHNLSLNYYFYFF